MSALRDSLAELVRVDAGLPEVVSAYVTCTAKPRALADSGGRTICGSPPQPGPPEPPSSPATAILIGCPPTYSTCVASSYRR